MSEDFIRFENVKKVYHTGEVEVTALHDVSFSVARGEICVIVGESGAGKTTLLNVLGGMDSLTEGSITVDGEDISAYDARRLTSYRRCDVGFVFQFYNLIPNLTALENVELAARPGREPADAAACGSGRRIFPRSSPAASSSAWPSPARWRKSRSCFCATSPRARSTIRQARPF